MDKVNLFLMDMSEDKMTSGVDRYLSVLKEGLKNYPSISVYRIRLLHSPSLLFYTEEQTGSGWEITLPLPQKMGEIIKEYFWTEKYNDIVYHLIKHLFNNKTHTIIHIHTLNLIDLALHIKKEFPCKIITHLHCIPWKESYNFDMRKFNRLYELVYVEKNKERFGELLTSESEIRSYTESDRIICVTECAHTFLNLLPDKNISPIEIIPNGMNDYRDTKPIEEISNKVIELLYVGILTDSKGLFYILDAIRIVQQRGYKLRLNIAGKTLKKQCQRITDEYADLELNILGCISFDKLKEYYQQSDIGVIASLQEQASYVAIEMSMFGLPVITTAVDGLDETFENEVNALKVNANFSRIKGLTVDVPMLSNCIIELIEDENKRLTLGKNARTLYENKLSLDTMMQRTISVYNQLIENTL